MKSPLGVAGVALLGLSVIGCGGFGGLAHGKGGKKDSKKACAAFSRDYHAVDEALEDLQKLRGKSYSSNSSVDALTAFLGFLNATSKFDPKFVLDPMSGSVESALTALHDSLARVKQDLDTSEQGSTPDLQSALDDGQRVPGALAGLKAACGQS
ncbi:MAG: hypothetical protein ACRC20_04260 [Segniliparus sp.]|uniref:hypothetical protein n=1 Tax=Segniliparus sp. TaxID=2804064 RepID=UPI003F39D79E